MTILRMEHVGIVVEDLAAATEFFVALGFELDSERTVGGEQVDRIVGLEGVQTEVSMLRTANGHAELELIEFHSPPAEKGDPGAPANARGIRHLAFTVDDIEAAVAGLRERGSEFVGEVVRYKDAYLLCYVRGPEGIIVELAEKID